MNRNTSAEALILRVRAQGESNREAWFLSEDSGVERAILFGGPKSRLRSYVSPFNQGRIWLYRDPVRETLKISDFDVRNWRPGIRENYLRTMAADAAAETVLASQGGGGGWDKALALSAACLDALETAPEKLVPPLLAQFLWKWAAFLGVQPDLSSCALCAKETDGLLWYVEREGQLVCGDCAGRAGLLLQTGESAGGNAGAGSLFAVSPGARKWLGAVESVGAGDIGRWQADSLSLRQGSLLARSALAQVFGKHLPTWKEVF